MILHRASLLVVATALALLPAVTFGANAVHITKCKDAQGHWHYGDSAATDCGNNKITVINDEGMRVKEIDGPLTEEQQRAKKEQQAKQDADQRRTDERRRHDHLLLANYGNEAELLRERDRRLSDIAAQIEASEDTLKTLRATLTRMEGKGETSNVGAIRAQVERHEQALNGLRKEQEATKNQFETDLQRFRELKASRGGAVIPAAAPSAAPAR